MAPTMVNSFQHLHMPADLACDFLALFSRIEYALKSTHFAIGSDRGVEPAWDKFANEIDEQLSKTGETVVQEAITYLLECPPRKQVLVDGQIEFVDQTIDDDQKIAQQLLLMVRTVRNNLFHGGKYLPDGEIEAGRNKLLVKHSMIVLRACVQLDDDVYASFQY